MKNFSNFGVMIDCSRNAVPNKEGLKKFIKIISDMGYNFAMLYTEDTYEVENEPFFGYKRGRYSKNELKEIDSYARSVGVELIPCIQTLAHLNAPLHWDEYRPIFDIDDIIMVDEERTYELVENMFRSLAESYTSRKVHIGMDEAHHVGLGRYLDAHGYSNRYELLLRHLNKVCDIAKKYGFEPMMWSDMFYCLASGGSYHRPVESFPDEVKNSMPKELSLVYWDYYRENYEHYSNMLESHKRLTDKIWFAGGAWCWGDFAPHSRLSMKRNEISIKACLDKGIKNVILTMWGDNGGECTYFSVLPALMHAVAIAEGMSEEEMKEKFREITGENYDSFIDLDLPNYIFGEKEPIGQSFYGKQGFYNDVFLGLLDNNEKRKGEKETGIFEKYSEKLKQDADKSRNFAFLFNTMAAYCDVLSIKFDLGKRVRAAYAETDKETLKKLAENDFSECIKRMRIFYETFRTQWYTVNKTYGFEIQDLRLGGLILRMESCRERLLDYCDGKIDKIEELEEPVMFNDSGIINSWARMITANTI